MEFYILKPQYNRFDGRWAYGEADDPAYYGDAVLCRKCRRVLTNRVWEIPHRLKLSTLKTSKLPDFLWGAGFDLMVSTNARELLEAATIRGILSYSPPAYVTNWRPKDMTAPNYQLANLENHFATLSETDSEIVYSESSSHCSNCGRQIVSIEKLRFDRAISWNSHDIFRVFGLGETLFVSEHFKDTVESSALTNVRFLSAEQSSFSLYRKEFWIEED